MMLLLAATYIGSGPVFHLWSLARRKGVPATPLAVERSAPGGGVADEQPLR
jgi:hypothetical protein